MQKGKLTYALKEERLVHISEVENGLQCNCICPSCKQLLIAKKGNVNDHHFAHISHIECKYGYETSLCFLAKEIISKTKTFTIPDVYIDFRSYKEYEYISRSKKITVDKVELDFTCNDNIPDIILYSGSKKLIVKIFVAHKITNKKLDLIKADKISTIGIDLSKISKDITEKELSDILTTNRTEKSWLYNVLIDYYKRCYLRASKKIPTVVHGCALHTSYCPVSARVWNNTSYANVIDDCFYCDFCIAYEEGNICDDTDTNYVLCTGESGIISIDEIKNKNNNYN